MKPTRLVFKMFRSGSTGSPVLGSGVSLKTGSEPEIPALAKTMSIFPLCLEEAVLNSAAWSCQERVSHGTKVTLSEPSSDTSAWARSELEARSPNVTDAPAATKERMHASPMPLAAPVMMTDFPLRAARLVVEVGLMAWSWLKVVDAIVVGEAEV